MAELREFQLAAVDRIVSRLTDPSGSRRFLLADEVGLGKTLVAREVIQNLKERRKRSNGKGFTAVYICSNSEIAAQNCSKLCDEKDSSIPGRLTLLSLQSARIGQARDNGRLQVFAFTPGTSLKIEQGTGIAEERRLLLYLLVRIWRRRVNKAKWREFFRCSAGLERWDQHARFRSLRKEFLRKLAGDLQGRLKTQWDSQFVRLFTAEGKQEDRPRKLSDCLDEAVDSFAKEAGETNRKNRNRIIGELRKGLARVSLEFIDPNLILLDEFQRFSDILLESNDQQSIVGRLFSKGNGSTLVLSATPYKMYTLAHENEDHHTDFLKTLAFLQNEATYGPEASAIQRDLAQFRDRLIRGDWVVGDDDELYALCRRIEERLKKVMCRTERNWYLEDAAKGVEEVAAAGNLPQQSELAEYVHLRRFLLQRKIGDWNITDFWKSSPSVLSFMDGGYALIQRLRRERLQPPETALRPHLELSVVARHNAKFRLLFDKVFGLGERKQSTGAWKFLWVRPTYTYCQDTFYQGQEPSKFLIFSHWRFVPKAIAVLTSHEASKQIGSPRRRVLSAPLQFRERTAFYPFDICYPSLALAEAVNQLLIRMGSTDVPTERDLFVEARRNIRQLLDHAGVQLGKVRTAPLWRIMARVEAKSAYENPIRSALSVAATWSDEDSYLPQHVKQYIDWMDDGAPLSISPVWLDHLTRVALYSPAVSLLRAFRSIFPQTASEVWEEVLRFCTGSLRQYFNRRFVQLIIRRHGTGKGYTQKVLSYCGQAHFQAVLDEYAYLVHDVLQQSTPASFLTHLSRAMGMWSGLPGVNERTRNDHISKRPKPKPAHFALAFGDDIEDESKKKADGKSRKSAVREAFNSPFWPFVLATTSVGQEGLDFHLYCQDIVHWNLPSNPVDLEQREGRINRYDGLSIRRNIARDMPLGALESATRGENPWRRVFNSLMDSSSGNGRFKHGLFPHWVYQGEASKGQPAPILRRHLLFYEGSKDVRRYRDLKNSLSLYRLVFGQPRQQDILEQVLAKREFPDHHEFHASLAKYMINLSPFSSEEAFRRAEREAARLLRHDDALHTFLTVDVPRYLPNLPNHVFQDIREKINRLVEIAATKAPIRAESERHKAITALVYLLDPYDAIHDCHGVLGYADDMRVIKQAHDELLRGAPQGVADHAVPFSSDGGGANEKADTSNALKGS